MAESTQGTVHVLHPEIDTKPAKKNRPKTNTIDLPALVVAGEPVFAAGLTLLENIPRLRPYIAALRLLSAAGQVYVANGDQRKTINKIKKLRKKMLQLDIASHEYVEAHQKLMRTIDKL